MGSRAWIVILCMGLGSLLVFGFITKFAIDSSPELQSLIRFKSALLRDFAGRGIREVSLRRAQDRRNHQLVVTTDDPGDTANSRRIDEDLAAYFLESFEGRAGSKLEICYQSPTHFGCSAATVYRTGEVPLEPIRTLIADRKAASQLSQRVRALSNGCRLLSHARSGGGLRIEVQVPAKPEAEIRALAPRLEECVRREFGRQPYSVLALRLSLAPGMVPQGPDPPAVQPLTVEVRYDAGGREIREGDPRR